MTKTLKVAIVALAIVAFGATASAAFNTNLTVGSTGADVSALQSWLISKGFSIPSISSGAAQPGYFGAQTKAAVTAYQASVGLPATGFVGPLTRGILNGTSVPSTPATVNCPIGYTCTAQPGTTPAVVTNGTLKGGAGDITVVERNSGTADEVIEGESDTKVLGFEVEADGSDVSINSVRVELKHTGSGSDRLNRYAEEVSIMLDNKVVGTVDASDFSKSSNIYSKNIPVSGAIVRDGSKGRFYVAVSAVNNVDSNDIGEDWLVGVGQIRFEDATGVVLTDTTGNGVANDSAISETFTFEDLSTSGDIRLRVSEGNEAVNEPHSVQVDNSDDTNDVEVLSFKLDARGTDAYLNSIKFGVTAQTAGVTEIANDFRLMMGDEEVGKVVIDKDCDNGDDGFASTTDASICVRITDLDDDDVVIEEGDDATFTLVADINDVDGGFASGDELAVTLNADDIDADDTNGDTISSTDLTGSADSSGIEFLSSGVSVTRTSQSAKVDTMVSDVSTDDRGIFTIEFDVKAIEDDAFVELGSATRGTTESNTGANFVIQDQINSYAATTTGSIVLADLTHVSGGSSSGEFIKIGAGQTARFKLTVTYDPALSGGYRMRLYSVNFAATAVDATAQQVLTPEVDYRTDSAAVGN